MYRSRIGIDAMPEGILKDVTMEKARRSHRQRLQAIKSRKPGAIGSTLNNSAPKSYGTLTNGPRGKQLAIAKQRNERIARENMLLLSAMTKIVASPSDLAPVVEHTVSRSTNASTRRRELERIAAGNLKLLRGLNEVQPYYNSKEWELERRKNKKVLARLRMVKPRSPARSKSVEALLRSAHVHPHHVASEKERGRKDNSVAAKPAASMKTAEKGKKSFSSLTQQDQDDMLDELILKRGSKTTGSDAAGRASSDGASPREAEGNEEHAEHKEAAASAHLPKDGNPLEGAEASANAAYPDQEEYLDHDDFENVDDEPASVDLNHDISDVAKHAVDVDYEDPTDGTPSESVASNIEKKPPTDTTSSSSAEDEDDYASAYDDFEQSPRETVEENADRDGDNSSPQATVARETQDEPTHHVESTNEITSEQSSAARKPSTDVPEAEAPPSTATTAAAECVPAKAVCSNVDTKAPVSSSDGAEEEEDYTSAHEDFEQSPRRTVEENADRDGDNVSPLATVARETQDGPAHQEGANETTEEQSSAARKSSTDVTEAEAPLSTATTAAADCVPAEAACSSVETTKPELSSDASADGDFEQSRTTEGSADPVNVINAEPSVSSATDSSNIETKPPPAGSHNAEDCTPADEYFERSSSPPRSTAEEGTSHYENDTGSPQATVVGQTQVEVPPSDEGATSAVEQEEVLRGEDESLMNFESTSSQTSVREGDLLVPENDASHSGQTEGVRVSNSSRGAQIDGVSSFRASDRSGSSQASAESEEDFDMDFDSSNEGSDHEDEELERRKAGDEAVRKSL
jgi:hypothetical protein